MVLTRSMESSARSSPVVLEVVNGVRTPDAERDRAYDQWAWVHGRNLTKTAATLGIPYRTLHNWARAGRWRERYELERAELAPEDQRYAVALALGNAATRAVERLNALLELDRPLTKQEKDESAVLFGTLDRAGFSPIHYSEADLNRQRTRRAHDEADEVTQEQIDQMSVEELRAYSERRRAHLDQQGRGRSA